MVVDALRCRVCESEYPGGRERRLPALLRPARAGLRLGRARARRSRASRSRPVRGRSGATTRCCRRASRPRSTRRPGWTPLSSVPRLARAVGVGEVLLKLDHANPTHSFKDASSPSPPRRPRSSAPTRSRARRPATSATRSPRAPPRPGCARSSSTPPRSSRRRCSRPAVYGADMYAVRGSYDDCSRLVDRARRRGRLGVRQRQPARLLRRGLEDARLRDRRAARLGAARRGRRADRLGLALHEALAGLRPVPPARARRRHSRRGSYGGQAEGCAPVARAFADDRPVSPVRPGDGRAVARDRRARRRRSGDRDGDAPRRRDLRRARGRRRPEHAAARVARPASSARAPPASRSARCAPPRRAARSARATASSRSSPAAG